MCGSKMELSEHDAIQGEQLTAYYNPCILE